MFSVLFGKGYHVSNVANVAHVTLQNLWHVRWYIQDTHFFVKKNYVVRMPKYIEHTTKYTVLQNILMHTI